MTRGFFFFHIEVSHSLKVLDFDIYWFLP